MTWRLCFFTACLKLKLKQYRGIFEVKSLDNHGQFEKLFQENEHMQLPQMGQNPVYGGVNGPCWYATPVENFHGNLVIWKRSSSLPRPNFCVKSDRLESHCNWSSFGVSFNILGRETSYCLILDTPLSTIKLLEWTFQAFHDVYPFE